MIFNSCELGVAKPDLAVYEIVCARLGLDRRRCSSSTTHPATSTRAREAGLQAVLFVDAVLLRDELRGRRRARSPTELPDALEHHDRDLAGRLLLVLAELRHPLHDPRVQSGRVRRRAATDAVASYFSPPCSTVTVGLATRLWNHAGSRRRAAHRRDHVDATVFFERRERRTGRCVHSSRRSSSAGGAMRPRSSSLPPFARNCSIICWLKSFIFGHVVTAFSCVSVGSAQQNQLSVRCGRSVIAAREIDGREADRVAHSRVRLGDGLAALDAVLDQRRQGRAGARPSAGSAGVHS